MKLGIKQVVSTFLLLLYLFVALSAGESHCARPLGVSRHLDILPNNKFKASSEDPRYPASNGRVKDSGWAPLSKERDPYPYLEIDLMNLYLVCGFKIQGCENFKGRPAWVTRYRVQVSPEKNFWDSWNYIKPELYGGQNAKEIAYSTAAERKLGRYVRIFPMSYENWICMKMEVFGHPYIKVTLSVGVLQNPQVMVYTRKKVIKVEETVAVTTKNGRTTQHSFLPDYAQVIPLITPRKTELKVDACVLVPRSKGSNDQYMSGRVHEVKGDHYEIEWLMEAKSNGQKMVKPRTYHINELYVVFSAWCKKIDFAARVTHLASKSNLCLGNIVRVDSKLVFKTKQSQILTRISYKKKLRPPDNDYVSSEPVEPHNIILKQTELFYEDAYGCLSKGKVDYFNNQYRIYTINGKAKRADEVRYSKGHGFEKCKDDEKYCHDSRIPYKVVWRRCPNLKTWYAKKCNGIGCYNVKKSNTKNCKDENECETGFAACGSNAVCKNTPGFYKCQCPKGFESSNPRKEKCQDINECKKNVCHKYATCDNTRGSYSCSCKKGYQGDGVNKCIEMDECKDAVYKKKCEKFKYAMCKNTPGSYQCDCKRGYHGHYKNCKDLNECTSNKHKCSPHAHCTNTVGSYKCKCKKGFSGDGRHCNYAKKCKERLKSEKCHQNGKCVDISGGSQCRCKKGYSGDGVKSCQNINECKTGVYKCAKNAVCIDNSGSYSCKCKKGYRGDARKECKRLTACLKEFPDCDLSKATCEKDKNGKYNCQCKPGYSNNGSAACTDVDECTTGVCSKDSQCDNTDGSFSCSCKKGFQGNGLVCSEIDECKNEGACGINATCTNTKGSFRCECNKGFRGNPYRKCNDVDECKLTSCSYGQNCTNIPGSYVCSCAKGFRPDAKSESCRDIDECATISSPCGTYNYLSCENEPGSYSCRCKMGYTFNINDRKCEDINECKKKSACAKHAKCTNAEGSYSCICAKGYSGDGLNFCDANHSGSPPNKAPKDLLIATFSVLLLLVSWKT